MIYKGQIPLLEQPKLGSKNIERIFRGSQLVYGNPVTIIGYGTPPSQDANCIIHWDFGNPASYPGTGTTVTDLKGLRNGTLSGTGYTYNSAIDKGVLQSSDKSSKININSLAGSAFATLTGVTFEYLFKTYETLTGDNNLAEYGIEAPNRTIAQIGWQQFSPSPRRIHSNMNAQIGERLTTFNTNAPTNAWNHIVITCGRNVPNLIYLNGTNVATVQSANYAANETWVYDVNGSIYGGGGGCMIGQFGVWRMYSVALSSAEVLANYNFFDTII